MTPLSFITPLPADFVEYLLSDDTLRLPGKPYQWNRKTQKDNSQEDNDSDVSWSDVEDDDELGEGATDVSHILTWINLCTKRREEIIYKIVY